MGKKSSGGNMSPVMGGAVMKLIGSRKGKPTAAPLDAAKALIQNPVKAAVPPLPGAGPTPSPMNFAAPDQAMEKLKKQGTLLSGGNAPSLYSR